MTWYVGFKQEEQEEFCIYLDRFQKWLEHLEDDSFFTHEQLRLSISNGLNSVTKEFVTTNCKAKTDLEELEFYDWLRKDTRTHPLIGKSDDKSDLVENEPVFVEGKENSCVIDENIKIVRDVQPEDNLDEINAVISNEEVFPSPLETHYSSHDFMGIPPIEEYFVIDFEEKPFDGQHRCPHNFMPSSLVFVKEDDPLSLTWSDIFSCHGDFAGAYDKLMRVLSSILFAFYLSCCYSCLFEAYSQMFDKLLRALTASALELGSQAN